MTANGITTHGFLRARNGTLATFDFPVPGSQYTNPWASTRR
jgi:hypothetical protein